MASLNPDTRKIQAQVAAHTMRAGVQDRTARAGLDACFDRLVDPDGARGPAERACRAENARKAHFLTMALNSAQPRKKAAAARKGACTSDADA